MIARRIFIAALTLAAAACGRGGEPAQQGIVATYRTGLPNLQLRVEVAPDGRGRIEQTERGATAPPAVYTIVTAEGRNVLVQRRSRLVPGGGEEWVAMDGAEHERRLHRGATPPPPPNEPTGLFREDGEARVGEWTGTRYTLPPEPFRDAQVSELIVLRRADLAPLGRLLRANSVYAWRASPHPPAPYMRQLAELLAQGAPLRVGDRLTLVSLEFRAIDPARLEPPVPPLSPAELDRLMPAPLPPARPVAKR